MLRSTLITAFLVGWGGKGLGREERGIQEPIKGGEIREKSDMFKVKHSLSSFSHFLVVFYHLCLFFLHFFSFWSLFLFIVTFSRFLHFSALLSLFLILVISSYLLFFLSFSIFRSSTRSLELCQKFQSWTSHARIFN